VTLIVCDDGRGIGDAARTDGGGLRGMHERALLVGADLHVESAAGRGVTVRLHVPLQENGRWIR
jgi:two-component system sensor histidine kinase UhpB